MIIFWPPLDVWTNAVYILCVRYVGNDEEGEVRMLSKQCDGYIELVAFTPIDGRVRVTFSSSNTPNVGKMRLSAKGAEDLRRGLMARGYQE